jgi:hypothetical protein
MDAMTMLAGNVWRHDGPRLLLVMAARQAMGADIRSTGRTRSCTC